MSIIKSMFKTSNENWHNPRSFFVGYVNDFSDFQLNVIFHRLRLSILARYMVKYYPKSFHGLNSEIVDLFFRKYHDRGKNYFSRELYSFYGKNIHDLQTEHAKNMFQDVMGAINRLDEIITSKFLESNNMIDDQKKITSIGNNLLRLENIVDKVDRGMYPGSQEEFNKHMLLASDVLPDTEDQFFAKILEQNYKRLTQEYWLKN